MEIARDSSSLAKAVAAKVLLFDDEKFTLQDGIAKREIYKPLTNKSKSDTKALIVLNLTKEHFKSNGAATFSDLKDDVRILVDNILNALSFATDKKKRISQLPSEQKKKRDRAEQEKNTKKRKGVPSSSEKEEEAREAEETEQAEMEKDGKAMGGRAHLRFEIETLVEKVSPKEDHLCVVGFRLWIFDKSVNAKEMDLVTKGLKECFIESGYLHQKVQEEIAKNENKQTRTKNHLKTTIEKLPKYKYTDIRTDSVFLNQVCNYFTSDENHTTSLETSQDDKHYLDNDKRRKFLDSHGDGERLGPNENRLPLLFSKELAMFSHVEHANVIPKQRCLESYFGSDVMDIQDALGAMGRNKHKSDRLNQLISEKVEDSEFQHYPFPSITYRVKCDRLSHDLFSVMPLPHRIGTFLYHEEERKILTKQLNKMERIRIEGGGGGDSSEEEEEEEEEEDFYGEERPLGIHDTEEEITITHLQEYKTLLSAVLKDCVKNGTSIASLPKNELQNFRKKVASLVRKELIITRDLARDGNKHADQLTMKRHHTANPGTGTPTAVAMGFQHTTMPFSDSRMNNDKKYMLCRKIASITGMDDTALLNERRQRMSAADLAYYTPIISQFRPVEATIENVKKFVGKCKYDETYMERDIFLVQDILNEYGFQQIDRKFYGEDGKVRKGEEELYRKTKRLFREAITVEFWVEFFKNNRVSMAHLGIREDLEGRVPEPGKRRMYGRPMATANFNIKTRPYGIYKEWVYSYFRDYGAINHHYKTMNSLYFARLHHCRSYPPGAKNPKLNMVLHGQGMGGKSHRLNLVKDACPTGVVNAITHWTAQIFNTDMNLNDMLIIYEELSNKLIAPSAGKAGGSSEAANDDARNNFKEQTTAGETKTASYFQDEETGDRKVKFSKCQCQNVILGATNNDLTYTDPNVISRFIVDGVAKSNNSHVGSRAQDLMRHRMGVDTRKWELIVEEHREVHRVYFMIEQLIKAGVLGDTFYGTPIDGADTIMKDVLDMMEAKFNIKTGDVRKRNHVIEMARCMCISYAVWYGLCSPLTRHLQFDPITGEFIGFNPRVILEGIVPHLVVTKDMMIDSLTTLSCLWSNQHKDAILENIATVQCRLHDLRECDFSKKAASDKSAISASSGISTTMSTKKKSVRVTAIGDLNPNSDALVVDYNYIMISGRDDKAIHDYISTNLTGDLVISADDVKKTLHELRQKFHKCDAYTMETTPGGGKRLVRVDDLEQQIDRRVVDYGSDANGNRALTVCVAYLKQQLPHLFPNIEDASVNGTRETNKDAQPEGLMEVEDKERRDQIMDTICIRANSANEDAMCKSIRIVLENAVLEYDPENAEQWDYDMEVYQDYEFGTVPWLNYCTANHPPALIIEDLYPDIYDAYSKLPQHNKDLPLVDQMAILQLKRNPKGRPLVIYNYNTVAPTTRSCLSVYQTKEEMEPEAPIQDPSLSSTGDGQEEEEEDLYVTRYKAEMAALYESDRRRRDVTQRRFKLYSETPSIRVEKDVDMTSCKEHLINIGHEEQYPTGRLCNYPPHVYMDLVDHRERVFPNSISLGLYANVAHKIAVTREIIEDKISTDNMRNSPTFADMMFANYHKSDRDKQDQTLFRSNHGAGLKRRSPEVIAREKKKAQSNLTLFGQKYRMNEIGKINTTVLKGKKKS